MNHYKKEKKEKITTVNKKKKRKTQSFALINLIIQSFQESYKINLKTMLMKDLNYK